MVPPEVGFTDGGWRPERAILCVARAEVYAAVLITLITAVNEAPPE